MRKKALKIFGLGLAALLAAAAGLLLWLSSSSGAGFVAGQLSDLLAEQGLSLSAAEFSGPLPGRFEARELVLADDDGPLFKAGRVEARLALAPLLRGRLHIPLIAIVEPELIRLPRFGGERPEEPGGVFSPPLELRLDELKLVDGRLPEGALAALGLDTPPLNLSAAASAQWLEGRAGLDLNAELNDERGREILALRLRFNGGDEVRPDQLDLSLDLDDQPGGLLSRISRDPGWGGLQGRLSGRGPLSDWPGRLDLTAGRWGQIAADLHFAAPDGRLGLDFLNRPDWQAGLKGRIAAGAGWPPEIADRLGGSAELSLSGELNDSELRLDFTARAEGAPAPEPAADLGESPGDARGAASATAGLSETPAADALRLSGRASWARGDSPARGELRADLQAEADWSLLDPGLTGPLTVSLRGQGRPGGDLTAEAALESPEMAAPQGIFTGLAADLAVNGRWSAEASDRLAGRLMLRADESPGGPLKLSAEAGFQRDQAGYQADIADLAGSLAGLDLTGALTATLAEARPRLNGGLRVQVAGWERLAALTGQPLSGSPAHLEVNFEAPEGRQRVQAEFSLPDLKLGSGADRLLDLNQVGLILRAEDLFDRQDLDLSLKLGPGRSGPLAWNAGSLTAAARSGEGSFTAALDRARLAGAKASARDGLEFKGRFDLPSSRADLEQLDFRLAGGGLKLAEPLSLDWGRTPRLSPLKIDFQPGGHLAAQVDLSPGALKIKADLQSLPYRFLRSFGVETPEGTVDRFTADLAQGPAGLDGDFRLQTKAAWQGLQPGLELTGRLSGGPAPGLSLEGRLDGGPGWKSGGQIQARLPLRADEGLFPAPDRQAPLSGRLSFSGDLGPLWGLLRQPDRTLTGLVEVQAELGGSLTRLQPRGSLYLAGGRYADRILGLRINEIALEAHAGPEAALSAVLSARDQQGGGLALEARIPDLNRPLLSARGRLSRFNPLLRDDLEAYLSGDLAAEGPPDRLEFSSDLTVDRGELDLKLVLASGTTPTLDVGDGGPADGSRPAGHRLALKIKLPNQFFIRGYGLESEWRGDLSVNGSLRRPSLVGFLAPVRGYFEIFSKQFQFSGGEIAFNGGVKPSLNLELTNSGPEIDAILRVEGSSGQPKLSFDSRPSRPQEEVLSQVLFGKSASSVSRLEALQLARALREVSNFGQNGGFSALGFMRESLGLDVLRLGGSETDRERRPSNLSGGLGRDLSGSGQEPAGGEREEGDAFSVEAGKYISDNIYVGVEHGAGGPAVRMEVELRPNLSLEGKTSTESSRVGLGWKKDY